jgi:GDP-L-fucose synthase
VGSGSDLTILELTNLIARVVGFTGRAVMDASKPDGTPRKLLDTHRLASLGWHPKIGLEEGLASTYRWFVDHFTQEGTKSSIGPDRHRADCSPRGLMSS